MSDYKNSEYALNRSKTGIVYRFADATVEISLHEFLLSSSDLTEQDFLYWKQVSNQMHLEDKRADWRQSHRNVSLFFEQNSDAFAAPSAEDIYLQDVEEQEEIAKYSSQLKLAHQALCSLSHKQRRRFLLHHVYLLTTRQIAQIEGVSQVAAHLSIQKARTKIRKFLEKCENEPKTP